MKILKIQSNTTEEISELLKILDIIINYDHSIEKYKYLISYFDGVPNNDFDGSFNIFFDAINNKDGLIFNYNQLKKKLKGLFQIYDFVLLIDKDIINFEKKYIKDDDFMHNNFFISINYFDGGFWEISCLDHNLLNVIETMM